MGSRVLYEEINKTCFTIDQEETKNSLSLKMATEKFCLRWNDFETNISSAFRELRDDKDFFDVTLACEDEQIQAHKVILSACSPFFRNVLRRNPHQHPLLYLRGVKYTDLQSVLTFMYHGEVNVAQEELNSFLAVAEELRVKGLTQNNQGREVKQGPAAPKPRVPPPAPLTSSTPAAPPPAKRPRPAPVPEPLDDDIEEVVPVKTEPRETLQQGGREPVVDEGALQQYGAEAEAEAYEDYGQYEEQGYGAADNQVMATSVQDGNKGTDFLNQYIAKVVPADGGGAQFQCNICGKVHGQKPHAQNHVESKHFPEMFVYNC